MRLLLGSMAVASAAAFANFDIEKLLTLQAMNQQFTEDRIDDQDQQRALMRHFTGASDMQLFMSKEMSADEFKQSMKRQMKDQMITNILSGGGIDLSNPMWRRQFFKDRDDAQLFTESMPEPQQSIIRLIQSEKSILKDYGKELLKRYQYKQFNTEGSYFTENFDHILLADDKKAVIKEILQQSMLENIADPLDRAMMGLIQKNKITDDADKKKQIKVMIKDLQKIKLFQGSVPKVSPVKPDHLFTFYSITNGELKPQDILELALNDQDNFLSDVSELDFERYFGSPAKQFSCRAHVNTMKVPCGLEATAEECLSAGCCFNPDGAGIGAPACYHDLYGKIGSGLLRNEFIESSDAESSNAFSDHIKSLFGGDQIPSLQQLLRENTPSQLYGWSSSSANGLRLDGTAPVTGYRNWWESATVKGQTDSNGKEITAHLTQNLEANRPRYGRPGFEWKPHGPTQSPYHSSMPGINPTAAPGHQFGDLNQYYKMWLAYAAEQDAAQCALIPKSGRIKCMRDYDALVDQEKDKKGLCKAAGCCFNEDSFLAGHSACYRAANYGTCSAFPEDVRKRECGSSGISESECIANPRCCYKPSHDRADPWCFYKYSATLEESEWCTAWNLEENRYQPRNPCFDIDTSGSSLFSNDGAKNNDVSNINNLISKEQCEASDCCFDDTRPLDAIEWIQQGLDKTSLFRCFKKESPNMSNLQNNKNTEQELLNHNKNSKDEDLKEWTMKQKTCTVEHWKSDDDKHKGKSLIYKRSCGEGLSYFQCVYNNRCCYQATTSNEPTCYHPEIDRLVHPDNPKP